MAKTITWTPPYSAPIVTPSLQAGGSLDAGVTYYYRVVALKYQQAYTVNQVESPASTEVSATTDAANRTIRLSWPQVSGANYYTVYRSTNSGNYGTNQRIAGSPTVDYATVADGGAGGTTFDDSGTRSLRPNIAIFIAADLPLDFSPSIGKGSLTITGGSVGDPITLEDVYNAIGDDNFCKYIDKHIFGLLGNWLQHDEATETHFFDEYKIIYAVGEFDLDFSHVDSVIQFGNYSETYDYSYGGCIFFYAGAWNCRMKFYRGCYLYGCNFFSFYNSSDFYHLWAVLGYLFTLSPEEMKDGVIAGFTNVTPAYNPTLSNIRIDNAYAFSWQDMSNTDGFTIKGGYLYIPGTGLLRLKGLSIYSKSAYDLSPYRDDITLDLINPFFNGRADNVPVIYWGAASTYYTGYIDIYFEFDLKVIDKNNNPINGAIVRIDDKDGTTVVNTSTGTDGTITTQEIKRSRYTHKEGSGSGTGEAYTDTDDRSPFTLLITKGGYETYRQEFTLTEQIDWTISLRPSPYVGPDAMGKFS